MNHLAALFIARILSQHDLASESRDPRKREEEKEEEKERERGDAREGSERIYVCRCNARGAGRRSGAEGWAGPIRLIPRRRPRPKERNKKE